VRALAITLVAACGSPAATTPDAAPDAPACAGMTCGTTCCTPAADCAGDTCACPAGFVPDAPMFITGVVVDNLPQVAGLHAAIGQFDANGKRDAILVAYDPNTAPIGIDIDLATVPDLKIGFGYDIDPLQNIRSAYRITHGTLRLDSVCTIGVSGSVTGGMLEEIDLFDNLASIPNGCTFALPSVTFAVAKACP
jgi:hypothetical protein